MSVATRGNSGGVELVSVYEISKILATAPDLETMMRELLRLLAYQLQMQRGRLYLLRDDGDLRLIAAHALGAQQIEQERDERRLALCSRIIRTGMPEAEPEPAESVACRLGVPIKACGRLLGILTVDRFADDRTEVPTDNDVRFLGMVANLIGQTVRLHRSLVEERSLRRREQQRRETTVPVDGALGDVVYASAAIQDVLDQARRVAPFRSTVLIRGESGTGKELIAHAIHTLSPRAAAPFVRVNCAALSETLLESELFGHERGAFTGANKERKGRFELAAGGTLFLDEIGEISPSFQAKLLRVLQEGEFERVGGAETLKTDVRIIAATNTNLEEAVGMGRFRADLYFRINVVSIFLPPLRQRPEDIPILARHFVARFNRDNGLDIGIEGDAIEALARSPWPGNVRELENCIERAATQCRDGIIRDSDLAGQLNLSLSAAFLLNRQVGLPHHATSAPPHHLAPYLPGSGLPLSGPPLPGLPQSCPASLAGACIPGSAPCAPAPAVTATSGAFVVPGSGGPTESEALRERLLWAMERTGWVQAKAARLLGMTTRQVRYALQKHNIEVKRL
ncbi:MAG: nif-specific transcriptional activator NifA [Azospirillum sp.]|nr:nif-specific transcriptional activator NifA [Azospirillum sp.]